MEDSNWLSIHTKMNNHYVNTPTDIESFYRHSLEPLFAHIKKEITNNKAYILRESHNNFIELSVVCNNSILYPEMQEILDTWLETYDQPLR